MEKVIDMLMRPFYLETVEGDQARVRPFDSCGEHDGKIYFETTTDKKVYLQLLANPKFEIFTMAEDGRTLRLTGEAELEEDQEVERVVVEKIGKYLAEPNLAVFKITHGHAVLGYPDMRVEEVDI